MGIPPSPSTTPELPDALTFGADLKGRGAGLNPGNRFEEVRLHVLGDYLDEVRLEREAEAHELAGPDADPGAHPDESISVATRIFRDKSRSILNHVTSPDIGYSWTINPYRGCEHGCIYCYARPGHEYLGWSSGLDFETKILAKTDAPEMLRAELLKKSWHGEYIVISGVTDCYQPVERKLRITRGCLEVCAELAQPVSVITKNHLITRDADLLGELAKFSAASAAISITSLDNDIAMKMEPRASSPKRRLEAVRKLTEAGVPVTVMVAPIVPSITDTEVPAILQAAKDAGATSAGYVMLRLPYQNKDLFLEWLERHFPDRAGKVESQVRAMHGGKLYASEWFKRQRGDGPLAAQIEQTFDVFKNRLGLGGSSRSRKPDGAEDISTSSVRSDEFLRRKALREGAGGAEGGGQLGLFG